MSRRETIRESREEVKLNVRGEERSAARIPMDAPVDKLSLSAIPGYHLHWINDVDGRIHRAILAGYEFINSDFEIGGKLVAVADKTGSCLTRDVGGGVTAYAMMLENEYRAQDEAGKALKIAKRNASVYGEKNNEGFYDAGTVQENSQRKR